MSSAYCNELRLGLEQEDIDAAGDAVGSLLGYELELKDDLERGGTFYLYEGPAGLIEVSENLVNGKWQHELRPELRTLVRVSLDGPHALDLGGWMARFERECPFAAAPFAAVARPSTVTERGHIPIWGYEVDYDASGAPVPGASALACSLAFHTRLAAAQLERSLAERFPGRIEGMSATEGTTGTLLELEFTTRDLLLPGRIWHALEGLDPEAAPVRHALSGQMRAPGQVDTLTFEAG